MRVMKPHTSSSQPAAAQTQPGRAAASRCSALRIRCNEVRRLSFSAGTGLLLLVSACSTIGPVSDSGPAADPAAVAAPGEPEPAVDNGAAGTGAAPASAGKLTTRQSAKRVVLAPRRDATIHDDQPIEAGMGQPDAGLQALIDGGGEDAASDRRPVAGPVPKLEPLAAHANRPYRLRGRKYRPMTELQPFKQRGVASWYGRPFHGRRTATGERYDMNSMSAAHPTLPLPSYVKVTNLKNGTSVIVRVNDRGPFAHNRVIDLSRAAAQHLGIVKGGLAAVELNLIVPEPAGTETPAALADVSK